MFEPQGKEQLLQAGEVTRCKNSSLSLSEVMTIIIIFHSLNFRTFKHFYTGYVLKYLRGAFPRLVSYNRRVELIPSALISLCSYLRIRQGRDSGISYIGSIPIIVCHPKRAHSHQLFEELVQWGKNLVGWFYGFKLHLIINDEGELLAVKLNPANVDDQVPVPEMTQALFGKLFGDKGYISQPLFELLFAREVQLITKLKKNMKNKPCP